MWALAQLLPAPAFLFTRYLIVVPRPLYAALLVVHCRCLIVMPRPLPRPRRCRSRRRTNLLMCSGKEQILPACSVELSGCA
jgi:hypothetical protein